jgi:lipoprotein signal peptidase
MFLLLLLIFIDQLSKYLVRHEGGFYICNEGISFGLHINPIVFWALWLMITTTIIYIILKNKHQKTNNKQITNSNIQAAKRFWILDFESWNSCLPVGKVFVPWNLDFGILLILSGALSNVIDRLQFGCVIDFINQPIGPIFNLADVFISIGVIITVVSIYKHKQIL